MRAACSALLARPNIWRQTAMAAAAALLLLLGLTLVWPSDLLLRQVHSWQVFHYVLGAKYFDELGYRDFYNGLLLADSEDRRVFTRNGRTRDLDSYYWVSAQQALARARERGVRQRFTDQRWQQLKVDLRAIQQLRTPRRWSAVLLDRGYNPSPAWLALHYPLLNALEIRHKRVLFFVCNLQLLLYLLTFAVAWWAFGGRATVVGTLWCLLFFGNWTIFLGGYFSRDWLMLVISAVALYRKGHPSAAAPLLAYATMMRGFPAMLALAPGLAWLRTVLTRRPAPIRRRGRFVALFALTCLALVALGSVTGRGPSAWRQWLDKITLHSAKHQYTDNVVGLGFLLTHDYRTGGRTPTLRHMERVNRPHASYYLGLRLALVLLTLLAMLRREDHDGMLLGIAAVFFATTVSRYYISIGALLFSWTRQGLSSRARQLSGLWLFALLFGVGLQYLLQQPAMRQMYLFFNAGLALYFVGLVAQFLVADAVRLRAR